MTTCAEMLSVLMTVRNSNIAVKKDKDFFILWIMRYMNQYIPKIAFSRIGAYTILRTFLLKQKVLFQANREGFSLLFLYVVSCPIQEY